VGYDAGRKILEIEFHHGAIYQYFKVPRQVYDDLVNSSSLGSSFLHNIKNAYAYNKLK
jgi:hypothetical protein